MGREEKGGGKEGRKEGRRRERGKGYVKTGIESGNFVGRKALATIVNSVGVNTVVEVYFQKNTQFTIKVQSANGEVWVVLEIKKFLRVAVCEWERGRKREGKRKGN